MTSDDSMRASNNRAGPSRQDRVYAEMATRPPFLFVEVDRDKMLCLTSPTTKSKVLLLIENQAQSNIMPRFLTSRDLLNPFRQWFHIFNYGLASG